MLTLARARLRPEVSDPAAPSLGTLCTGATDPARKGSERVTSPARSDAQVSALESGIIARPRRSSFPPPGDAPAALLVQWVTPDRSREVTLTREQADLVQSLGLAGTYRLVPGAGREPTMGTSDLLRMLDACAALELLEAMPGEFGAAEPPTAIASPMGRRGIFSRGGL